MINIEAEESQTPPSPGSIFNPNLNNITSTEREPNQFHRVSQELKIVPQFMNQLESAEDEVMPKDNQHSLSHLKAELFDTPPSSKLSYTNYKMLKTSQMEIPQVS